MRGWQIFRHSVQLVFRNFDAALRVSLVPYLATIATHVYLYQTPGLMPKFDPATGAPVEIADPGAVLLLMFLQMASILGGLWIAVTWHRYVLKEELTPGWVQPLRPRLVLAYLVRSVMLGLLMLLAAVALVIPGMMLMGVLPETGLALIFAILTAALYAFFRFGIILPAGAVDTRMTLHAAAVATTPESLSIFVISGLAVLFFMLLQMPVVMMQDSAQLFALVYGLALNWVVTMVGASLLTSLYGICVEGRSID